MSNVNVETKKTVTVVDKATKALTKTMTDITKIMKDLETLVETSNNLSFAIELKSQELADIEEDTKFKLRDAEADLHIQIKENESKVLDHLLSKFELGRISLNDLSSLRSSLNNAEASREEDIGKAVEAAIAKVKSQEHAALVELNAKHSVESAELKSENISLKSRIEFLQESNDKLQRMLDAEREARVEMSKNASQPTINVNSAK